MRFQLLSIWTRLFLTTLDIIYYKARLHFQRFRFWLEEEWSMYRDNDAHHDNDEHDNDSKQDYNSPTNSSIPHSRYAKNKSAHKRESNEVSKIYHPHSVTP